MFTQNIEYDVLVSCVRDDAEWAQMLVNRLRKKKIPTRLNDRKEPIGQQLRNWLKEVRGDSPKGRKFVAVCSDAYLNDAHSLQLLAEFRREQASRLAGERLLIPVLVKGCLPPDDWKDLPALDFSNERDFELRFLQLIEALDWQSEWQNGFRSLPAAWISRILGRKLERETIDFADSVAEIYRMLEWEVSQINRFDSISGEFLVSKMDAGVRKKALVECHDSALSAEICQRIVERARQNSHTQRIVIASHPVSSDLDDSLREADVNRLLYTELLDELAPLKKYAAGIVEEFEQWRAEHWEGKDWFIRPDVTAQEGAPRESAIGHVAQWLEDRQARYLAILGDLGTGKTILMRFLAYELAKAFLADPLRHPAPIFIELLWVRKATRLKSILNEHFDQKGLDFKGLNRFEHLIKTGRIILLLDAFDEMADRLHDEKLKLNNLQELLKPSKNGGRIVITSRTHYFKNHDEQVRLLGQEAKYIYLAEFTEEQVQEYLAKARPTTSINDWSIINSIYSLRELVRRPLFMDMVVTRLPAPGGPAGPNSSRLYTEYVDLWVQRESGKERRLVSETRIGLMEELAWRMWSERREALSHDEVKLFTERILGAGALRFGGLGPEEVLGEICTASFLRRDREGNFSFADRSFQEYFIASRLRKCFVDDEKHGSLMEMLAAEGLEQKIIFFLTQLNEDNTAAPGNV